MDTVELSKSLSWLLRHGAREAGVSMDAAGWVPVDEVLRYLSISRATLDDVVSNNTKSRLAIDGDRIRAVQGHSTENMPITLEALEASWPPYAGTENLWHGTTIEAVEPIAREGLWPQKRTHVHLAPSMESKVGKRSATPVVLEVSIDRMRAAGQGLWEAQNGVVLVRHVPLPCIVSLTCTTHAARKVETDLRAHFDWRS